jgi:protein-S-isoprenylcysteine O-methyltransferase Ste14
MTTGKMSIFGIGPWFVLLSAIYTVPAIVIRAQDPAYFQIPFVPYWVLVIVSLVLLVIGLPFFAVALVQLVRGFPEGKLFTSGTYGMCRHPVYGCWVVFNVPGIVLLMNSWLGLLVPVLMYATLRLLVRREETHLKQVFAEAYRRYRSRTPAVFPLLWRSRG